MCFPSELNAIERTPFVCPSKVFIHFPDSASHILMVLSHEPLAIYFPSGLYDTKVTKEVCPSNVWRHLNFAIFSKNFVNFFAIFKENSQKKGTAVAIPFCITIRIFS